MEDFQEIMRQQRLPDVGQTVRSKKYGTEWRVMEKKEVWQDTDLDPKTGKTRKIPAIFLNYWKVQAGVKPGQGRMMGFLYTLHDNTFALHWDIISTYEGESMRGELQDALEKALERLDTDFKMGNVSTDPLASWKIVEITGKRGGIAPVNIVKVKIEASRIS